MGYVAMTATRAQIDCARAAAAQARLGADAATVDLRQAMRVQQSHVDAAQAEVDELKAALAAREEALVQAHADAEAAMTALEEELKLESADAKRKAEAAVEAGLSQQSTKWQEQTRELLERNRRRQEHGFRNAIRIMQHERRAGCAGWLDEERKFAEYSAFAEALLQDSKTGVEELKEQKERDQALQVHLRAKLCLS